jgi:hypothetical protein
VHVLFLQNSGLTIEALKAYSPTIKQHLMVDLSLPRSIYKGCKKSLNESER